MPSYLLVVDDMRSVSLSMLKSHYTESHSNGRVGRVEFLPIYWYDALRNEAVGKSALIM